MTKAIFFTQSQNPFKDSFIWVNINVPFRHGINVPAAHLYLYGNGINMPSPESTVELRQETALATVMEVNRK